MNGTYANIANGIFEARAKLSNALRALSAAQEDAREAGEACDERLGEARSLVGAGVTRRILRGSCGLILVEWKADAANLVVPFDADGQEVH